jgi:hypothetical protein
MAKAAPAEIPARNRDHLATPAGLLFNELLYAPEVITSHLTKMLEIVLDMDAGAKIHTHWYMHLINQRH